MPAPKDEVQAALVDCFRIISHDYPPMEAALACITDVKVLGRLDRKKGIERTVYVIELSEVPAPLSIEGSWIRTSVQSQLKGYLIGKLGLPYHIDVDIQAGNFPELVESDWRTHSLTLEEALATRFIEPQSPFIGYMKKYEINEFVLSSSYRILGPNIGAMAVMERVLAHVQFETMVDLFTGTGALLKVGLQNGVTRAHGFDANVSVARKTLAALEDRIQLTEGDTFLVNLPSEMGLVVADPTMPLNLRFANLLGPVVAERSPLLLLTHGHREHTLWNEQVRRALGKCYCHLWPISALAMEITACTNNDSVFLQMQSIFPGGRL